jgi:hypothetical protein
MNGGPGGQRLAGVMGFAGAVLFFGIVGVVWYFGAALRGADRSETERKDRAIQADEYLTGPAGRSEEYWLAYVDGRISESMKRRGGLLEITPFGNGASADRITVSLNWPYKITCLADAGALVEFGAGDDAVIVPIFSFGAETGDKTATVGVNPQNAAASDLGEALCRRVSDRIEALMSPELRPPTQP